MAKAEVSPVHGNARSGSTDRGKTTKRSICVTLGSPRGVTDINTLSNRIVSEITGKASEWPKYVKAMLGLEPRLSSSLWTRTKGAVWGIRIADAGLEPAWLYRE